MEKVVLSENPVVPDSIEPVVGWKGMMILPDGKLISPNHSTIWEPGQPLEAECRGVSGYFEWQAMHVGENFITVDDMRPWEESRPKTILPAGMEWRVVHVPYLHEIADIHCSCGVYVTRNTLEASHYGDVMMEVYGWGNTTVHSEGWRCQYAYPKRILVRNQMQQQALQDYGVPVEIGMGGLKTSNPQRDREKRILLTMSAVLLVTGTVEQTIFTMRPSWLTGIVAVVVWIFFLFLLAMAVLVDRAYR